jgi:hypothetical protein
LPTIYESTVLTKLTGIPPNHLNRFIEREQFGIDASVRTGKGRGSRRLFSEDDVFGIALVWWLFESGLRSQTIQYVLNQLCGGRLGSKASDAAKLLIQKKSEFLGIMREPRTSNELEATLPEQTVYLFDAARAQNFVQDLATASVLIIPVGSLFKNLQRAMHSS